MALAALAVLRRRKPGDGRRGLWLGRRPLLLPAWRLCGRGRGGARRCRRPRQEARPSCHRQVYRRIPEQPQGCEVASVVVVAVARRARQAALPPCGEPRRGAPLEADDSESDRRTYGACWDAYSDDEINLSSLGVYVFNLGFVPSENLRVLNLTNCSDLVPLPPASAVVFPRLSSLRLHHGTVRLDALQSLIDAAPALATVLFESVIILPPTDREPDSGSPIYHQWDFVNTSLLPPAEALLRLPAATVLALERCNWKNNDGSLRHYIVDKAGVVPAEIDAPRLRRFSEERRAELLPTFFIRQRLELHGVHRPKGKTAAVAIANLLHCCPMLHDLRINLTADHHYLHYWHEHDDENRFLERKFSADREKSIDLLTRHRNSKPTTMSPKGNDAANYDEVSEIPGLSQHSFDCLGSSWREWPCSFGLGRRIVLVPS
uniref:FBD domain-containing protein n=1 Tax=Aegilops tauschii TaxID=37682 RepID=N1QST1_AEGTA